eukprot:3507909-Prymnesium_polylepis.1
MASFYTALDTTGTGCTGGSRTHVSDSSLSRDRWRWRAGAWTRVRVDAEVAQLGVAAGDGAAGALDALVDLVAL